MGDETPKEADEADRERTLADEPESEPEHPEAVVGGASADQPPVSTDGLLEQLSDEDLDRLLQQGLV